MFSKYFDLKLKNKWKRSLVIINKKSGITSHDEIYNLRKIFNIKKIGHSGTLDPKVTGVLVCGIGKGTKALEYILLSEKRYEAIFEFHQKIERKVFEKTLKDFLGQIIQLPPVKSSVKREERKREIYDLKILEYDKNNRFAKVLCAVERGTYIRKLAHDIGLKIGVNISMGDMKRIQAGPFSVKNSNIIDTDNLKVLVNEFRYARNWLRQFRAYKKITKYLYPIEELFLREKNIKKISINKKAVKYIKSGNPLRYKNLKNKKEFEKLKMNDTVAIFYKKEVLAVGKVFNNINNLENEFEILKLNKVF